MTEDMYQGIAERYDLIGRFGEHDPLALSFFRQLFESKQVESVLDCACGTGRHLALFHSLGCEVVGSDISDSMLDQARKNLTAHGVHLPLHKVDYRDLRRHLNREFDAVMCLSSSILHMHTEAQVLCAFESMRQVLRPGGILVLTQGTTDKQWRDKPRFVLAVNERDVSRLFVIDYIGEGARYHLLDIYHTEEIRELKVWSVDYPRVYLRDDQVRMLQASGFKIIDCYGSWGFDPYDPNASDRLVVVAQK